MATRTKRFVPISDRYSMLGTLAHRACLMAFGRQWSGGDLARTSIAEQVTKNTELLVYGASVKNPAAPGSLFRSIVDPGGPYWGNAADDWVALPEADRQWVLDTLPKAAHQAAHLLTEDDRVQRYKTIRSEVRLNRLDSTDRGCVADLICFTADGRLVIIDLKFVHGGLPVSADRLATATTQVRGQMKLAREGLRAPGSTRCTRKVEGWLLYVAYRDNDAAWVQVK